MSDFAWNALMMASIGAAGGLMLCALQALSEGVRKAAQGALPLIVGLALMGALAALPTLLTGERLTLAPTSCPSALMGGPSC